MSQRLLVKKRRNSTAWQLRTSFQRQLVTWLSLHTSLPTTVITSGSFIRNLSPRFHFGSHAASNIADCQTFLLWACDCSNSFHQASSATLTNNCINKNACHSTCPNNASIQRRHYSIWMQPKLPTSIYRTVMATSKMYARPTTQRIALSEPKDFINGA